MIDLSLRFQPWEEKMKDAYEQGRLVLLENLDPSLTSSEVQVIIIPKPAFSYFCRLWGKLL